MITPSAFLHLCFVHHEEHEGHEVQILHTEAVFTTETQVVRKNRNLEVGIGPVGRRVFHSEKTTTLSGCFDLDFLCSSSAAQIP
jgi:hypothetical protein